MPATTTSALSTPTLYAHLSWKQADIIICLDPDMDGVSSFPERAWRTTKQVSEFLEDIKEMDLHENDVRYWGTNYSGTYSTLMTMLHRGVVKRDQYGRWGLTQLGRQIAHDYL